MIPPRPSGTDSQSYFFQWVWDMIVRWLKEQEAPGTLTSRTTRGVHRSALSSTTSSDDAGGAARWA